MSKEASEKLATEYDEIKKDTIRALFEPSPEWTRFLAKLKRRSDE